MDARPTSRIWQAGKNVAAVRRERYGVPTAVIASASEAIHRNKEEWIASTLSLLATTAK
jgi:hypothetical protein